MRYRRDKIRVSLRQNDARQKQRHAFTIVEVVAALAVLSIMLTSVMVLINRYIESVMDLQLRQEAFETARSNMETLLAESRLSDMSEYGTSELNPDVEWETVVEPFYEPITNRMWIRAVCSAGFKDTQGEHQDVELEHWITDLTSAQIKQILAQQKVEEEYLNLLNGDEDSAIQETTLAYLKEQGLDTSAYERFIAQQKRQKIEYINKNGFDGYEEFVEKLKEEEDIFLEEQGMDFDGYNTFAASYVPRSGNTGEDSLISDIENDSQSPLDSDPFVDDSSGESPVESSPDKPVSPDTSSSDDSGIDWSRIPPELVPLFEQLLGVKKPK